MEIKRLRAIMFAVMAATLVVMVCTTAVPRWMSSHYGAVTTRMGLWAMQVEFEGHTKTRLLDDPPSNLKAARSFSILAIMAVLTALFFCVLIESRSAPTSVHYLPTLAMLTSAACMMACGGFAVAICKKDFGGVSCTTIPDFSIGPMFATAWVSAVLALITAAVSITYHRGKLSTPQTFPYGQIGDPV